MTTFRTMFFLCWLSVQIDPPYEDGAASHQAGVHLLRHKRSKRMLLASFGLLSMSRSTFDLVCPDSRSSLPLPTIEGEMVGL